MSLLSPEQKMSKSLGDNHCLYIDDEPEIIRQKLTAAVTDIGTGESTGAKNLLDLVKIFSQPEIYQRFIADQKRGQLKYSELKEILAKTIADYFSVFRKNKQELSKRPLLVKKALADGAKAAKEVAAETMKEVRKKIGIR